MPDKPVPLRRNRDFILLWSGQVVSTIGTRVSSLAYPLLVLALTHSPAKAGLVGFAQTLPFLIFYLPAGALVDRWNRKRIMLVADAGRAVALASIALALALDQLTLAQIAVVAFVEGSLFVFFQLSEGAALPHVVPKEQLPTALAQNQAREQGAELVGQPLGGLLFGIGRLVPFVFDAVTYAVSFVTLLFVRPTFQETRPPSQTRLRAEVAEGIAWLWQSPLLRAIVFLVGASNFAFAALTLVMIVRAEQLGASPSLIGAMFAFLGVGAIAGAMIAPWVQRRISAPVVVIGTLWLYARRDGGARACPECARPRCACRGDVDRRAAVQRRCRFLSVCTRLGSPAGAYGERCAPHRLGPDPTRLACGRFPPGGGRRDQVVPRPGRYFGRRRPGCDPHPCRAGRPAGRGLAGQGQSLTGLSEKDSTVRRSCACSLPAARSSIPVA